MDSLRRRRTGAALERGPDETIGIRHGMVRPQGDKALEYLEGFLAA
jgi:hypothetical protein